MSLVRNEELRGWLLMKYPQNRNVHHDLLSRLVRSWSRRRSDLDDCTAAESRVSIEYDGGTDLQRGRPRGSWQAGSRDNLVCVQL